MDMEVTHPDIQAIADHAEAFCGAWAKGSDINRLLVLCGEPGCGKTHALNAIANWGKYAARFVWERRDKTGGELPSVLAASWADVSTPERCPDPEFREWLAELNATSLACIDDIGTETDRFRSGDSIARLCQVLDRRAKKFTVLTTNKPPELWGEQWDARVSDRLTRGSRIVVIRASSYSGVQP